MIFIFKVHVHKLAYCMHVETLFNSGKLVFVFCFFYIVLFLKPVILMHCTIYRVRSVLHRVHQCTIQRERLVDVVTSPSCLSALIWSRKQTSRHTNDVTCSLVLTLSRTAEFLMFLLNAFTQPNLSPVKQCA